MKLTGERRLLPLLLAMLCLLAACDDGGDGPSGEPDPLEIISVNVGPAFLTSGQITTDVPIDRPVFVRFSTPIELDGIENNIILQDAQGTIVPVTFSALDQQKSVSAQPVSDLAENAEYTVVISGDLRGVQGERAMHAEYAFRTLTAPLELLAASMDGQSLFESGTVQGVPVDFTLELTFSHPLDVQELADNLTILYTNGTFIALDIQATNTESTAFVVTPGEPAAYLSLHELLIKADLTTVDENKFAGFTREFYTEIDETPKFPVIPDEELLTLVQQQTFRYFWDFAHPVSGLARERNSGLDRVTSGGSGFGLMAIPVAIERGFITRAEGVERIATIVDFLSTADRFHGAWSHWLHGATGEALNFSAMDNGGDIVETSFMAMGLLTVRQYLNANEPAEKQIRDTINALWHAIEWDWYTKEGTEDALYWHWSPDFEWAINHRIGGYSEALITYIMAASSPTHPVDPEVYHTGWARNGNMVNGNTFFGIELPLGPDFGGPLFFSHYTYLGIDPRNLADQYANYWELGVNHSLINREHCIRNPIGYVAYSERCWGLTASDGNNGYSAHSPTNDRGVITPTAAISAMPYVPDYSMDALKFFYYTIGDRLWGEYGFYDAFNLTEDWVAGSYLAIDQGPIIIMIENYRTGMLWDLFMSCPEVQEGLTRLGFTYE